MRSGVADSGLREAANNGAERTSGSGAWQTYAGVRRENPGVEALLKEIEQVRREADAALAGPSPCGRWTPIR
jgi:hypothetical protein